MLFLLFILFTKLVLHLKKGIVFILLSTLLFSTMEIALHLTAASFNPVQMNFLRFFIGSLILLPPALRALKKRGCTPRAADWAFFALTGFICVVVSMMLYQMAILYAPASLVAVLFSCNPVFVVLFALPLLGERILPRTVVSAAVSVLGILIVINPLHMAGGTAGITLTLLAAVTFALYGVVGHRGNERFGGVALTCFSFLAGSAEMLALMLLAHAAPVARGLAQAGLGAFAAAPVLQGITLRNLPGLLYIGVFVTGLGYAFYFLAMEATSATTASLVFFFKPVLAPLFALLILREAVTPRMLAGIAFILAGSLISLLPALRAHPAPAQEAPEETLEEELDEAVDEARLGENARGEPDA